MATTDATILFDIVGGILPFVFIIGDTYLQIGDATRYRYLAVTAIKLISVMLFSIFLVYLYFVKEQPRRESNNLFDLVICVIMVIMLMSTMSMILYKINKDKNEGNLKDLI